ARGHAPGLCALARSSHPAGYVAGASGASEPGRLSLMPPPPQAAYERKQRGTLDVLPSPTSSALALRAWGGVGGGGAFFICLYPPPLPPPNRGEGNTPNLRLDCPYATALPSTARSAVEGAHSKFYFAIKNSRRAAQVSSGHSSCK